ncbi:HAMP domain-containing histidine kinase [Weissella coleopterorum]|uniref:histidine kinase n=1 Tax=Weissella coleopterorum TaxID=2714949 RepID=A0A6G8AYF6_9LACO|nr:HAMP domain-containing sensor histidine kinase [Weissella coleopterorum]QIL50036.1 HAMP domain-containing histidine kinase [Weissella coleopterorum]
MKLSVQGWAKLILKMLVGTVAIFFLEVGALLMTQVHFDTKNWVQELLILQQHHFGMVIVITLGTLVLWLWLMHTLLEQAAMEMLTTQINQQNENIFNDQESSLLHKMFFLHLGGLIKSINNTFVAAHMAELRVKNIENSKDEMIGNISHDLRTPLTALIGYLGLVKLDPKGAQTEKYVNIAYDKAEHMKTLVEDLYEYVQVNDHNFKLQLHMAPLNLSAMLSQLVANYELESKQHHMEVRAKTDPDVIKMAGDQDRLARVFMNLISNAFKYGERATYIELTASLVSDTTVEVRVANDGQRIPEEAIGHVFDRFYRVESSRNLNTGGSGLGLAIVGGIIEAHNGTVRVESNDQETAFILTLPLQLEI